MLRKSDLAVPTEPIGTVSRPVLEELVSAIGYVISAECTMEAIP